MTRRPLGSRLALAGSTTVVLSARPGRRLPEFQQPDRSGGRPTTAVCSEPISQGGDGRRQRLGRFAEPVRPLDHAPAARPTGKARRLGFVDPDPGLRRLAADRQAAQGPQGRRRIARPPRSSFEQGKFAEAEKAFAKIAKDRKGTPWGETAQYYLAETQYQRGKYVDAHDSFEKLHADYPATDYLESWSAASMPSPSSGTFKTTPTHPRTNASLVRSIRRRFADHRHSGYALKAPRARPAQRPDGRAGRRRRTPDRGILHEAPRLESAAIYYDQFIAEYPKSPFLQKVQHAAIDARLKGYLGPEYDASGLEKARDLVRKTMETFPEQQASYEGLYHTLDVINNAEAEKTFLTGEPITSASARSPPPSITSARSPSAGPAAHGPPRPRSSWLNWPRCPEHRRSPARS